MKVVRHSNTFRARKKEKGKTKNKKKSKKKKSKTTSQVIGNFQLTIGTGSTAFIKQVHLKDIYTTEVLPLTNCYLPQYYRNSRYLWG